MSILDAGDGLNAHPVGMSRPPLEGKVVWWIPACAGTTQGHKSESLAGLEKVVSHQL